MKPHAISSAPTANTMDIGMVGGEDVPRTADELIDVAPPLLDRLKQAMAVGAALAPRGAGEK